MMAAPKVPVGVGGFSAGRTLFEPLVTGTAVHIGVFAETAWNSCWGEAGLTLTAELCLNTRQAMQAILRKYSPGLMTVAIYTGILLFALLCTFAEH